MKIPVLALFLGLGTVIILTVGLIYWFIYMRLANKRLTAREDFEKQPAKPKHTASPMVSPLKFIGIAIVAFWGTLLIFICISLALQSEDNNVTSYVTINDYDSETVKNTLLSGLSPDEEISGYTRQVQTDGNLTFVCYTSTNDNCKSFPAMLIYAEYTGSREYAENAFEIFGSDDASFTSVSIGGIEGETNHWFTVSANPDSSGTFVINCYEYSDSSAQLVAQEGGDSAMGQYADDSGSFAFDLSEVFG